MSLPASIRIWAILPLFVVFAGCGSGTLPIPEVEDPAFTMLRDVELGMSASTLARVRPRVEGSPYGHYQEAYGSGWITYAFGPGVEGTDLPSLAAGWDALPPAQGPPRPPPPNSRLRAVYIRTEFEESRRAIERWRELLQRVSMVFPGDPICSRHRVPRVLSVSAVWPGVPGVKVAYVVTTAEDGQSDIGELAILVRGQELTSATETTLQIDCGEES